MKLTKSFLKQMIKEELEMEAGKLPPSDPEPKSVATIPVAYNDFVEQFENKEEAKAMYKITEQAFYQGRLYLRKLNGKVTAIFSNRLGNWRVTDKKDDLYLTDPNNIEMRPIKY